MHDLVDEDTENLVPRPVLAVGDILEREVYLFEAFAGPGGVGHPGH